MTISNQRRYRIYRKFGTGKSGAAFSLVEMIFVLAVLAILAAFTAPTLLTLQSANLTTAGGEFGGFLKLCRSKAIAERTSVRLAIVTSASNPDDVYRKYAAWKWDKRTEDYVQFSEWKFIPTHLAFENRIPAYVANAGYADVEKSVIEGDYVLTDQFQNSAVVETGGGEKLRIHYLTFAPSGRAYIEGGEKRNLILVIRDSSLSQRQIKNWYQFTVDTLTGRTRIYRP